MALSFRIAKIPVRILPSFFLTAAILAFPRTDVDILLLWVPIVLGSVLVHELGHASVGLLFGLEPQVLLHGMGGTTSWTTARRLSTWQRLAISLAGPGFGFATAAAVVVAKAALVPGVVAPSRPVALACSMLLQVNFGWGLFNLLPMLPLDGGDAMMQILNAVTGGRGERPARRVSIGVAGLAVLLAILAQWWWSALLAVSFISSNWRGLKELDARAHDAPMHATLAEAYVALEAKDGAAILRVARPVALGSTTTAVRAEALQLMAFGFLLEGRVADADAAIAGLPAGYSPHASFRELRARAERGAGTAEPSRTTS